VRQLIQQLQTEDDANTILTQNPVSSPEYAKNKSKFINAHQVYHYIIDHRDKEDDDVVKGGLRNETSVQEVAAW